MKSSVITAVVAIVAAMVLGNATAAEIHTPAVNKQVHADRAKHGWRQPRHAVTLWWVIFNEPQNCETSPGSTIQCGGLDIFGSAYLESVANGAPDPDLIQSNARAGLAVVHATGGITTRHGRIRLVASIFEGTTTRELPAEVDPMGLNRTLTNADAEIHLVMRDHGRRHPRDYVSQITSFVDPYCSDPNLLYFAGPNLCQDVQFAVFGSGQSGDQSIFAFADSTKPLSRARARLIRRGGAVQAVFETVLRRAGRE